MPEVQELNEGLSMQRAGMQVLAEKWSAVQPKSLRGYETSKRDKIDFLEGIDNDLDRCHLAQLLENTHRYLNGLDESTRMANVGSYEKFLYPIIRALYANLVTKDLVTVYPLQTPSGTVFFMDANYGSSKGSIARGTRVYDSLVGPDHRYHYTDEVVDQEVVATGTGLVATYASITLAYTPVRPGTVQITDGAQIVRDDGNGNLVGDIAAGTNTINYVSGAANVTFAAVAAAGSITATYEYDMEGNSNLPELDLQLTSAPVIARTQKLVARWSLEAQQDLQAYLQQNLEVEIVGYMTNMIAKELNTKIIRHIRSIANGGTAVWDRTPPTGVQYILHKPTFYDSLIALSNSIFARTQRMEPNWIVAGVQVCNIIETMGDLFTRAGSAGSKIVGVRKIGTLGQFDIYKDPSYPACEYLMGCKGANFLDAGYIWSPYLMLYTTPPITLEDMVVRRGMMQRTGTKVINSLFYATGQVIQQGGEFGGASAVGPKVCTTAAPGGTALPPGSEHIVT